MTLQGRRRGFTRHAQLHLRERRGIHGTGSFNQIVSLVHQNRAAPLLGQGLAIQHRMRVEKVVVVAHNSVCPTQHLLAQIIGADLMLASHLLQALASQHGLLQSLLTGSRKTVVKPSAKGQD